MPSGIQTAVTARELSSHIPSQDHRLPQLWRRSSLVISTACPTSGYLSGINIVSLFLQFKQSPPMKLHRIFKRLLAESRHYHASVNSRLRLMGHNHWPHTHRNLSTHCVYYLSTLLLYLCLRPLFCMAGRVSNVHQQGAKVAKDTLWIWNKWI